MNPVNKHTPDTYFKDIYSKISQNTRLLPVKRNGTKEWILFGLAVLSVGIAFKAMFDKVRLDRKFDEVWGYGAHIKHWRPQTDLIFTVVDCQKLMLTCIFITLITATCGLILLDKKSSERREALMSLQGICNHESFLPEILYHVTVKEQADQVFGQFDRFYHSLSTRAGELKTNSHHFFTDLSVLPFRENRIEAANALIKSYYEWHKYTLDITARRFGVQENTRGYVVEIPSEAVGEANV